MWDKLGILSISSSSGFICIYMVLGAALSTGLYSMPKENLLLVHQFSTSEIHQSCSASLILITKGCYFKTAEYPAPLQAFLEHILKKTQVAAVVPFYCTVHVGGTSLLSKGWVSPWNSLTELGLSVWTIALLNITQSGSMNVFDWFCLKCRQAETATWGAIYVRNEIEWILSELPSAVLCIDPH